MKLPWLGEGPRGQPAIPLQHPCLTLAPFLWDSGLVWSTGRGSREDTDGEGRTMALPEEQTTFALQMDCVREAYTLGCEPSLLTAEPSLQPVCEGLNGNLAPPTFPCGSVGLWLNLQCFMPQMCLAFLPKNISPGPRKRCVLSGLSPFRACLAEETRGREWW